MKSYSDYLHKFFPYFKVQKLSINAGFSCPNRDGTLGTGGCIYCRNDSFTPSYCKSSDSIEQQLEKGKKFFSRKYPEMRFLAFFQSYTSTYDKDINFLNNLYHRALSCEKIVGLVISTRPDSLPDKVIEILSRINSEYPVFIELGAETAHDDTLKILNRNHSWNDVCDAVHKCHGAGLHTGLHLIAGLPGETKEMILESVRMACSLPIETIKIHHLQILKDTILHQKWENGSLEVSPFSLEDYLELCSEILDIIPENIIIERLIAQSPPDLVVAPKWDIKNYQFYDKLKKRVSKFH